MKKSAVHGPVGVALGRARLLIGRILALAAGLAGAVVAASGLALMLAADWVLARDARLEADISPEWGYLPQPIPATDGW